MAIVWACAAAGCARRASPVAADLIVTGAAIWTGDASRPEAQALAIIGDRIVDVGSVTDIDRWRTADTQVVEAHGRRVVPGFNDAHVHFAAGGAQLTGVDLRDAPSVEEFARRIVERARNRPGEWITGGHWDQRRWPRADLPTRAAIDDATNGTPVFVVHADGQRALANAAALGRAGITERTPDPTGGAIVRDASGLPTGILEGAAMDAVARVIPTPTDADRRNTIARALEHAASLGVTSVQDMNPDPADVAVYAEMATRGVLTTRIVAIPAETTWFDQARLGIRSGFGSAGLRLGAVAGDVTPPSDEQLTRLMAADHAGLQLCVNASASGPAAALDLLASIVRANGVRDRRFRIEHAEQVTTADADRMASLGAVASVQPTAADADVEALRRLVDRHVAVALGTDWPTASLNPMLGIAAAARRAPIAAALAAYTRGSAFAEFQDTAKGALARGMLADLVVLSDDILTVSPEKVPAVTVDLTVASGKIVHQRRP